MSAAKFQDTYDKIGAMGKKLKDAGKSGPTQDEQLKLYGYAKIAQGIDIKSVKKPGVFDLSGKAKYNKWNEFVEAGVTEEQAKEEYVKLGEELLAKHDK